MKNFRCKFLVLAVIMLAICAESWADTVNLPENVSKTKVYIKISANNFPDELFRNYISQNFDKDGDGMLSEEEIASITEIDVSGKGISSLKGIGFFKSITTLKCSSNQLTSLDLSKNTALTVLYAENNKITSLNLTSNTALTNLHCDFPVNSSGTNYTLNIRDFMEAYKLSNQSILFVDIRYFFSDGNGGNLVVDYDLLSMNDIITFPGSAGKKIESISFTFTYSNYPNRNIVVYPASDPSLWTDDPDDPYTPDEPYDPNDPNYPYDPENPDEPDSPYTFGPYIYITTTELPDGEEGKYYIATLNARGTEPITWSLVKGSLPDGLSLSTQGTISGTPSEAGAFTFTVRAQNDDGASTKIFTILVPFSEIRPPKITTESLPDSFINSPYGFRLKSTGTTPIIWTLADGSTLPEGFTLTSTGYIYGTPKAVGTSSFTIKAENSAGTDTAALTLKISSYPENTKPTVTTEELEPAAKGAPYVCQLMASGTPPFTWTIKGKLPVGLSMTPSGLITGTPTKTGSSKVTFTVTNDYGSDVEKLTLTVYEIPQITTTSLKDATVAKKYSVSLKTKGSKPLEWDCEGSLPLGIVFDEGKGKISGTPPTNDSGMIRVTLTNPVGEVSKVFKLRVKAITPTLTPNKLSGATYGKVYKAQIKAKGTVPIIMYISGDLPRGLTFSRKTGKFTGTPREVCADRVLKIIALNMGGILEKDYKLTVKAVAPKFITKALPDAKINESYIADINAEGTPTITFTAEGLPDGLSMSSGGRISGIPAKSGTFTVKITAVNDSMSVKKSYKLNVLSAPEFSGTTELAAGTEGKSYSQKLTVSGTAPMTFTLTDGSLPNGITLAAKNGTLKGKPKEAGNFTFTIKATNSVGSDEQTFTLTIAEKASKNKSSAPLEVWDISDNEGQDDEAVISEEADNYVSMNDNFVVPENNSAFMNEQYIVVAELQEISVDVSGMYDFSATLSSDAEAGAKLLWLANSSEPSDDDDIAEFYDTDGEEIDSVPEDRKISVSVWLNEGVTYKPAIAAER